MLLGLGIFGGVSVSTWQDMDTDMGYVSDLSDSAGEILIPKLDQVAALTRFLFFNFSPF